MDFLRHLDHPLLFLFFLFLALKGLEAVLLWAAKEANMPGPAAFIAHQ